MRLTKVIKIGIAFFILLELTISFSAVWFLTRENRVAVETHKKSLEVLTSCNDLLHIMSVHNFNITNEEHVDDFIVALNKMNKGISTRKEKKLFHLIARNYKKIFNTNDAFPKRETAFAISKISQINLNKIGKIKKSVQKYHLSGAWAIVFLQSFIFLIMLILITRLKHRVLKPCEEIFDVVARHKKKDNLRRCYTQNAHHDIKVIGDGINKLLDEKINYEKF